MQDNIYSTLSVLVKKLGLSAMLNESFRIRNIHWKMFQSLLLTISVVLKFISTFTGKLKHLMPNYSHWITPNSHACFRSPHYFSKIDLVIQFSALRFLFPPTWGYFMGHTKYATNLLNTHTSHYIRWLLELT